jgi:DNA-directed RNA polymerase
LARSYAESGTQSKWVNLPGGPFCWTAKSGFPVVSEYHLHEVKEGIAVRLGRTRLDTTLVIGDKDEMDVRQCRQAATANFIHSMDAAHLHEVVASAKAYGIRMVTVHDCFSCLAPRAEKLNQIIRMSFIMVHGLSFRMLHDMRAKAEPDLPGVDLPEVPLNHGPFLNLADVMSCSGWA